MAEINGSSVTSNKSPNVPQCSGLVSEGNGSKNIEEESVRWDTGLNYDGNYNDKLATERLEAPKSGMRRNNLLNGSENAPYKHAEVIRPQGSSAWLRLKELIRRPLPEEPSNMEASKRSNMNYDGRKSSRFEKVVEAAWKEQCFERNSIVKALPDEAPSQQNVTFVTRSFEVNPTTRKNWSTLKEAVMSGRIVDNMEDGNEMSGLRRLNLAPTNGLDAAMPSSSVDHGHRGWLKVKAMHSSKIPRISPVNDNNNSLHCSDGNDECFGENTSEVIPNFAEEELYTDVDSTVQALPSDTVNRDVVVSVTRSFEYDTTWANAREILRKQRRSQEKNDGLSGKKNSKDSLKLIAEVVKNAVLKKDAFCQTEFDPEGIFQHQVIRYFICATCGSKCEEKEVRKIEGCRFRSHEVTFDEDECGGKDLLVKQGNIEDQEEKTISELNFHDECTATFSEARLVEDKFEDSEASTKLEKDENEEIGESLENGRCKRNQYSFDAEKNDLEFHDAGYSIDLQEGKGNGSIYNQIRPKKNESEEYSKNRPFILEKCGINKESDNNNANNEGKQRDNPSEIQIPDAETATMIHDLDESQSFKSEQKDMNDLNLELHYDEKKEVMMSDTEMVMSTAKVVRENLLKGMKSSCTPVTITAKFFECEEPPMKRVEFVKVVRDVDTPLYTISYV